MVKFNLVFLLLATASVASAAQPVHDDSVLIKKIVFAAHQTNYIGTFIYQSGSYVETSRITHIFDGENEHERLVGLDGERSEVIRKNGQVWCYLGDSKVMVAKRDSARTFPALLPEQLSLLQKNYLTRPGEDDRVAGFPAHSLVFQPKDKMRYTHKMWADSNSGLLLKAVVLDERDHIIEQYAFAQLDIGGDIDRKWIVKSTRSDQSAASDTAISQSTHPVPNESGWMVYALPAGFKKITEVTRSLRNNHLPVTHLAYSDGLAGISVFIEKLGDKAGLKTGLYSKGAIQVYTKVLGTNLLTVVGEVPPRTVMQVAESVRFGGKD